MRSRALTPAYTSVAPGLTGGITPLGLNQTTMTLTGLALYLFCVHSFKLPLASLGIAIGVLGVLTASRPAKVPSPLIWFGAWLVWCGATGVMSPFRSTVADTMVEYVKIFLISFVAMNAAHTLSQLAVFIGTWVGLFGLFPLRGTYMNYFAGINQFGRYGWNFSFNNYNDIAAYAILALAMSAFLLAGRYARWVRVLAFLGVGSLALLVVLTQSRGAFLALALAFVLMLFRSRSRAKLIKFGLAAVLAIVVFAPGDVWERFGRMKYLFNSETLADADTSAEQRYVLLQVGMTIAENNLGKGVGLGAYAEAHGEYATERTEWQFGRGNRDTHNMYLNLLAETGIPGAMIFMGMLASTLVYATRTENRLRAALPLEAEQLRILRFGLVAYLIAAIFGTFHRISFLYMYLAVVWSAARLFEELLATARGARPEAALTHAASTSPTMRRGAPPAAGIRRS